MTSIFVFLELTEIFKKEMPTVCLFINSVFKTAMSTIWQYSNQEIYYRVSFNPCNLRQHKANVNAKAISLIDCLRSQNFAKTKKFSFFFKKRLNIFLFSYRFQDCKICIRKFSLVFHINFR